eukprot:jgi/Picre1/30345/NNA_005709.t1
MALVCSASSEDKAGKGSSSEGGVVAKEGDVVTVHWACWAGDIVGNQLFEAFDEAVRGLSVGETIGIKADGGEWKEDLLFKVPMDHPEIQRMANRYKSQGGVHEGLIAELSNGGLALVVECTDEVVTLDANSMMAGKTLLFEIELLNELSVSLCWLAGGQLTRPAILLHRPWASACLETRSGGLEWWYTKPSLVQGSFDSEGFVCTTCGTRLPRTLCEE